MLKGRIMGLDYGEKRFGVAVSDLFGWTARGLETIQYNDENYLFAKLEEIIKKEQVIEIVIGIPLKADGELSEKGKKIKDFSEKLKEKFNLPINFIDESYSSVEAKSILHQCGKKTKNKKNKNKLDSIAAEIILTSYLKEKGY